jgi:hypothetical protein
VDGIAEQAITIRSNDAREPERRLTVRYSVGPSQFQFEPAIIDFGRITREELPLERHVVARLPAAIEKLAGSRYEIAAHVDDPGFLTARSLREDGVRKIFIRLESNAPSGELATVVRCKAPSSEQLHELQVSAYVRGAFFAKPTSIVIPREKLLSGAERAEFVRIIHRDSSDSTKVVICDIVVSENIASWLIAAPTLADGAPAIEFRARSDVLYANREFAHRIVGYARAKASIVGRNPEVINVPVEIVTQKSMFKQD